MAKVLLMSAHMFLWWATLTLLMSTHNTCFYGGLAVVLLVYGYPQHIFYGELRNIDNWIFLLSRTKIIVFKFLVGLT